MLCHGELVRRRPGREHLTAFYLAMSCGGVLGGLFNALLAPAIFDRVAEYPLALILACLVLPKMGSESKGAWPRILDWLLPLTLGTLAWGLISWLPRPGSGESDIGLKLAFGAAVLGCYAFKDRPVRFALGVGAILLAAGTSAGNSGQVLYQHRNYFGVLRVTHIASGNYHRLIHGHTLHGQQAQDPDRLREPLSYYHRTGPIGQVFGLLQERISRANVAVVGLGAGTLACYAEPGQTWTFYEIDPEVAKIARDAHYFSFLAESRAAATAVVLGDARLRLQDPPEHGYSLLVLDAFSSDAIPVHLLTREALELYVSKLAEGGVVAFHISNRYVQLDQVLGALARDLSLACLVRRDLNISPGDVLRGKEPSIWAVMAARPADLGAFHEDPRWESPTVRPRESAWTDDFSNLIKHLAPGHM